MYLVIRELLLIPEICYKVCIFKQHILRIFLLFYSLSVLSFFENFSSKASRLRFIFICVSTGHAHCSNGEIHISCEPDRPTFTSALFSCKMAVNTARKTGSKSVERCSAQFSTQKRNLPLSKSLPVRKCNTSFI